VSVFSDERIIDALKDFVSVVQGTELQNHPVDDDLSKFFRSAIRKASHLPRQNITDFSFEGVKPLRHGVTTQGLYMFNAAGESYGGLNTNNGVEDVLRVLADAKRAYEESPPATLTDMKYVASSLPTLPEGAIVVRAFTRITPVPVGCSDLNKMIGRDHLWVLGQEIDALSRGEVPDSFAYRVVRHHLVDNIRGEPGKWRRDHVKSLDMSSDIVESGGDIRVTLTGDFSLLSPAGFGELPNGDLLPERGYIGAIEGEIVIRDGAVRSFRLLADGQHWGGSRNNSSATPEGKFPLKVAFVLAKTDLARTVPPHGLRRWRSNQEDYYGMPLEDVHN
jgi:hypothetical protein